MKYTGKTGLKKKAALNSFTLFARKHVGVDIKTTKAVMRAFRSFMAEAMVRGEVVYLEHFGTFWTFRRKGRGLVKVKLNPKPKKGTLENSTQEIREVFLPDYIAVKFKPSKKLKKEINHYDSINQKPV